jgi:predicted ATPase
VIAHRIAGVSQLCLGELAGSRGSLEALLARYTRETHGELGLRYGTDPAVSAHSFLSWVLWLQGLSRPALEHRNRAIALANEINHSHSLAHALGIGGCLLDCMRGDAEGAEQSAETLLTLGRKHSFPYWIATARAAQGWSLVRRRHPEAVSILMEAIGLADRACMEEFRPFLLAMLAEGHAAAGRPDRALEALDEALGRIDRSEERWMEAELHRLRGELLLATGHPERAEECLLRALSVSRQQGAKAWEERAAAGLARLLRSKPRFSAGSGPVELLSAGVKAAPESA